MSARAGGEICRMPLGEAATFRAGAPYWVVHRADLTQLQGVVALPDILNAYRRRAARGHRP